MTQTREKWDSLAIEDFTEMDQHGVKLAPIHLTYYCMLLFLSNNPSF